jgi:hypothetical protein
MSDFEAFSASFLLSKLNQELLRGELDHAAREIGPPALTERVLDLAYVLSLHSEEGRQIQCAILLSESGLLLPGEYVLDPPVPIHLDSLKKVALAIDRNEFCFHARARSDGTAELCGIAQRPRLDDDRFAGMRVALIEVTSAASVAVRVRSARAVYEKGLYNVDVGAQARLNPALSRFSRTLVKQIAVPRQLEPMQQFRRSIGIEQPWPKDFQTIVAGLTVSVLADQLTTILTRMRQKGRGGMLVLHDGDVETDSLPIETSYRLRPSGGELLSRGMLDFIGWGALFFLDHDLLDEQTSAAYRRRIDEAQAMRRRHQDVITNLSGIDGAVVLTGDLEPRLFGAKIKTSTIDEAHGLLHKFLRDRGTRHRSAAYVALANDGVAFVVSQDGTATMLDASRQPLVPVELVL